MEYVFVAKFDLASQHQQVLSFKKGERFLPLVSKASNKSWTFAVSLRGTFGYIPFNYIKQEPVTKVELTSIIEIALEGIERTCSGTYSKQQREIIQQLTTWRTLLLSPMHSPIDAKEQMCANDVAVKSSHVGRLKPQAPSAPCSQQVLHSVHSSAVPKEDPSHIISNSDGMKPLVVSQSESPKQSHSSSSKVNAVYVSQNSFHNLENCYSSNIECHESASVNDHGVVKSFQKIELKDAQTQFPEGVEERFEFKADTSSAAVQKQTKCSNCSNVDVPACLIPSLIENVRFETHLSHQNCKVAIAVVVDTLSEALPSMNALWTRLKDDLQKSEVIQDEGDSLVYSEDRRKLQDIFKQLWCCKNDEQQRSWPVHEDEDLIASLLQDLNIILMDANPKISKNAIQQDDYELVNLLVTYYQMEARRMLRIKMLHVFVTLCKLDNTVVAQLLHSVLPMELARDMQCSFEDTEKLQYSAFVLTIIFSTGLTPPNAIYDFVDKKFIDFLFEKVELFMRDGDEEISNHLLNILLAFNLHLPCSVNNPIFTALKEREDVCMLTVKLVFYVNREMDPINILGCDGDNPNSVLKFLVNFFAFPDLSQLFYLNDIKVLLDIIVRQLTDYLPGEKNRLWYLHLVENMLQNSNYQEHFHQQSGLQKCFNTILAQEDPCPAEIAIVKTIVSQYPDWFTC